MTSLLPLEIRVALEGVSRAGNGDFELALQQLRELLLRLYPAKSAAVARLIDRLWSTDLRSPEAVDAAFAEVEVALGMPDLLTYGITENVSETQPPAEDASRARLYQIWYGTNRRPLDRARPEAGFDNAGEADLRTVHYGTCAVSIPKSHQFGSLGSGFFRRWITWTDDRLRLRTISPATGTAFWQSIGDELLRWDANERQVLVFLHGFNVTFEEAALRAAQLGFDLNFPGVVAMFSWPSCGEGRKYNVDEATIEGCEQPIEEFLLKLVDDVGAERVHVVAHSMGNRPLLRAVRRIADDVSRRSRVNFGQIILAAPDVDARLFRQLAGAYPLLSQRTTHYVSPRDRAVGLSRWLHGNDRAGYTPPITVVEGIDTIHVPKLNSEFFGHNYFASAAALLSDIYTLIRSNVPPGERPRFRPDGALVQDGLPYWVLSE